MIVFHDVFAADQEALLAVLLKVFPELATLDRFSDIHRFDVVLLRHSASEVDHRLVEESTMETFVAAMELGIGLLHKGNPELVLVRVVTVQRRFRLRVVGDSCIDDYMLPPSILEEVEHCETILNTVVVDEVFQKLRVGAQDQKRSKEPAVIEAEQTLLNVARIVWISLHFWLVVW